MAGLRTSLARRALWVKASHNYEGPSVAVSDAVLTLDGLRLARFAPETSPLKAGQTYDVSVIPPDSPAGHDLTEGQSQLQRFKSNLSAGRPKTAVFWTLVQELSSKDCDAEQWLCGPLLDAVGISGRDLFIAMATQGQPFEMGIVVHQRALKTAAAAGAAFDEKVADRRGVLKPWEPVQAVSFDYFNGIPIKAWFPVDFPFGKTYMLNVGKIDRRGYGRSVVTSIGGLVQQRIDADGVTVSADRPQLE